MNPAIVSVRVVRDGRNVPVAFFSRRSLAQLLKEELRAARAAKARERHNARVRAWRGENKERIAARKRAYYKEHKAEIIVKTAAWKKKNKARHAAHMRAWRRKRRLKNNAAELRARPLTPKPQRQGSTHER